MKAMYKVEWRDKRVVSDITDERRYVAEASTRGFNKIVEHARRVTDRHEFISSIEIISWEKL